MLVTGATGSGKSTTQAAMLDYRNETTAGHILTVEDPIEFVHPHKQCIVNQREVGFDTISFNEALRNTLRQAPDVILIGEVRDLETMEAAITFAETGHLCLATLHSNNANQAIERVMNFFPVARHPEIFLQLSLNLRAIVSQRLVPGVDGKRVAALEILLDTPWAKDLIKKGEVDTLKEAMEKSTQEGGQTFDQSIFAALHRGADLRGAGARQRRQRQQPAHSHQELRHLRQDGAATTHGRGAWAARTSASRASPQPRTCDECKRRSLLVGRVRRSAQPIQIGLRTRTDRHGDHLGRLIRVQRRDARRERAEQRRAGLDHQQQFLVALHLIVPAIDRLDGTDDVHARRQLLADHRGRQCARPPLANPP